MYLDDVIIFSTDFEQHLRSTERVMSLLKAAGFLFTDYFTDFMSGRSFRQSSQEDVGVDKYSKQEFAWKQTLASKVKQIFLSFFRTRRSHENSPHLMMIYLSVSGIAQLWLQLQQHF